MFFDGFVNYLSSDYMSSIKYEYGNYTIRIAVDVKGKKEDRTINILATSKKEKDII